LKTLRSCGRSCERVAINNCILRSSCAAIKLGTESWYDFRHITISNCVVHQSTRAVQIFSFDGGTVEDVAVSNLVADTNSGINMNRPIHIDLCRRRVNRLADVPPEAVRLGRIRRVTFSNITLRTDGRVLLTAADGAMLEQITLRDITVHMPWIEDPVAVADLSDKMQSSIATPEARLARAVVVAQNVRDFRLEGLTISYPQEPPGPEYLPKYEHGQLVRDPRTQFRPMPAFHALWGRNLRGGVVDIPVAAGSTPQVPAVHLENSDVRLRND
jgi:hypothetical protein